MLTCQKGLVALDGEVLEKEESQQENKLQVLESVDGDFEDLELFLCSAVIEHLLQTGGTSKKRHQTSGLEGCRASLF